MFKIKYLYFCIALFLIHFSTANAQNPLLTPLKFACGTDFLHQKKLNADTTYKNAQETIDKWYANYAQNRGRHDIFRDDCGDEGVTITIPVAIHVVHLPETPLGTDENLSDEAVIAGLDLLNKAFAGQSVCSSDPTGVNINIQFCLAKRDINNNATNGITHHPSTLSNMDMCGEDEANVKGLSQVGGTPTTNPFPSTDYINIWLVKSICAPCLPFNCDVAGFSTLASSHGSNLDGYVNEANLWYNNSPNACHDAKVGVHEMGHFFNLYHTFEGGCVNGNCLFDGDQVCDTPPDNDSNYGYDNACFTGATPLNTCSSDADDNTNQNPFTSDVNDLDNNFMDYHPTECSNTFTEGQKVRMLAALCGIRHSLTQSNGCADPCPNLVQASFTTGATNDTIAVGTTISFTNTTTGTPTGYEWTINGTPFDGTVYTFNNVGTYNIVLKAKNDFPPNCFDDFFNIKLVVVCGIKADFTMSDFAVNLNESITFTNTSTGNGINSQKWFITDFQNPPTQIANTLNATYTFTQTGWFGVYVVVCNNLCCDTSAIKAVSVTGCQSDNLWFNGDFETTTDETLSGINYCPNNPNRGIKTAPAFTPPIYDHTTGLDGGHFFWSDNALTPCGNNFPDDIMIAEQTLATPETCNPYTFTIWAYMPDDQNNCTGPNAGKIKVMVDGVEIGATDLEAAGMCNQWVQYSYVFNVTNPNSVVGIYTDDEVYLGYDFPIDDISVTNACSPNQPIANFTATPPQGCEPHTVTFTNTSENAESYTWNFGDGTTSTDTNPTHIYTQVGTYNVSLIAVNGICSSVSQTQTITVTNCTPPPPAPCIIAFDWLDCDTVACKGENALIKFSTNANSVQLLDNNNVFITNINSSIYSFLNPQNTTCYKLRLIANQPANCDSIIPFCITVNPPQNFNWILADTNVCEGKDAHITFATNAPVVKINNTLTPTKIKTYSNQNGDLSLTFPQVTADSCYTMLLTNPQNSCDSILQFCIHAYPLPTLALNEKRDVSCAQNDGYISLNTTNGTPPYLYSFGINAPFDSTYVFENLTINTYNFVVQDQQNCTDTLQVPIQLQGNCNTLIPNAFSPNGDGMNDIFKPHTASNITNFMLKVYNRWGELLFETTDFTKGWDGIYKNNPAEIGVYAYICTFQTAEKPNETQIMKGNLTLIR